MQTQKEINITPRGLITRTAVASLALAATKIPAVDGDRATTVIKEATTTIRPFQIHFPDEALTDLRRRINATKWPEREPVADASQVVQLVITEKTRAAFKSLRP
ncbi:MAG: hypothetical protein L0Y58_10535 [Verrucomicrobia subdivision 3 bacterium]|nr:hypothetical protein [Limisphaerales bacterium]